MLAEEIGTIELKSAIHVTYVQAKNSADQHLPTPCIEFTHPGILTFDAIPQYSVIFTDEGEEAFEITDIELSVGVHEKDKILGHCLESTHQCRAITLVGSMVDETHTWIG